MYDQSLRNEKAGLAPLTKTDLDLYFGDRQVREDAGGRIPARYGEVHEQLEVLDGVTRTQVFSYIDGVLNTGRNEFQKGHILAYLERCRTDIGPVLPAVRSRLCDPSPWVRVHVAGVLALRGTPADRRDLVTLMRDPSVEVRSTAALLLGDHGDENVAVEMERLLRKQASEMTREEYYEGSWCQGFSGLKRLRTRLLKEEISRERDKSRQAELLRRLADFEARDAIPDDLGFKHNNGGRPGGQGIGPRQQ